MGRLSQRVVQLENSHIILTDAGAFNKLLATEVYTSNNQLGGIQIMYVNGVFHATAQDLDSVIIWTDYHVPATRYAPLSIVGSIDLIDRDVVFIPTNSPNDP